MPPEFLDKVKYLCKSIPRDEWSGPLFYSVEGSIMDPANFKITLRDILPLDKGSAAYTSYELDDRFVDYLMADEERMEWTVGHIHSHNNMDVFFSGTDKAELNDNCDCHNYYLSLIVNNRMDFEAKIAFTGETVNEIEKIEYISLAEDGIKYPSYTSRLTFNKVKMFVYDCLVLSTEVMPSVSEDFQDKVNEILKPKPVKSYTVTKNLPVINTEKKSDGFSKSVLHNRLTKDMDRKEFITEFQKDLDFEDLTYSLTNKDIYNFTVELFKFSSEKLKDETLDEVIEDLEEKDYDDGFIASCVLDAFAPLFEKHFPDADNILFISHTYEVLDLLREIEDTYVLLTPTIKVLQCMLNKFEEYEDSNAEVAIKI